jgi:hypothetical protein
MIALALAAGIYSDYFPRRVLPNTNKRLARILKQVLPANETIQNALL